MVTAAIDLLQEPDDVRLGLSPIRRRLLERLCEPASATEIAAELGMRRQRVNHHLRALEAAGLVLPVEERRRRGCVERILAARAGAFVVDPAALGPPASHARDRWAAQDGFAAERLVGAAAAVVRDVTRMQAAAGREGTRLLTSTVETEVRLAAPGDFERFAAALAERVAGLVEAFPAPSGGRRFRVVPGGHPVPAEPSEGEA